MDGCLSHQLNCRGELRRTTVGSSVPTSVAKDSFLMYDNADADEQNHFAGTSVETDAVEDSKVKHLRGIVVVTVYTVEVNFHSSERDAILPEATDDNSLDELVIVPDSVLVVPLFRKATLV